MKELMNKLYKLDSKNKLRVWEITVGNDKRGHYYEISHGQHNGKLQYNRTYVRNGKNIGKKNETSISEQCELEAIALWEAQISRKGYSESIPEIPPLKPMLAKKYIDEKDNVIFPCFIQPKLDGARCLVHINKSGVTLISRTLNKFEGLQHLEQQLLPIYDMIGPVILDGELFNPKLSFQTIMSLIRKTKNLSDESKTIEFWAYDIINENTYDARYNLLRDIFSKYSPENIKLTPTDLVNHDGEIYNHHKSYISDNFEGSIIRNINGLYKINSRSSDLLKYKDFDDDEFKIVGYNFGVGKFEKVPTFQLVTKNGHMFEAVPVGTAEQREEYLNNAKYYLGTFAKVQYFGYTTSDKPVPRHPNILEFNRKF